MDAIIKLLEAELDAQRRSGDQKAIDNAIEAMETIRTVREARLTTPRPVPMDAFEACPDCGNATIEVHVDHPTDPYTVREHVMVGKYGSAISGKKSCS